MSDTHPMDYYGRIRELEARVAELDKDPAVAPFKENIGLKEELHEKRLCIDKLEARVAEMEARIASERATVEAVTRGAVYWDDVRCVSSVEAEKAVAAAKAREQAERERDEALSALNLAEVARKAATDRMIDQAAQAGRLLRALEARYGVELLVRALAESRPMASGYVGLHGRVWHLSEIHRLAQAAVTELPEGA